MNAPPSAASLRESLRAANRVYQGDDYDTVLRLVPGLLTEARTLAHASEGDDSLTAQSQLAQVYQLTPTPASRSAPTASSDPR